jgi:MPBQ/MSBQ methyltransferase
MKALLGRLRRPARAVAAAATRSPPLPADLLAILACPETKEALGYDAASAALVARSCGRRYDVDRGIPVLLGAGAAPGPGPAAAFGARYHEIIANPAMRALFEGTDYFNVGLWDGGISGQVEACDRMVDSLAASIPPRPRLILDIGCGLGSGTRRLASRFGGALVVGLNISLEQLIHARAHALEHAIASDAARLGIASGVADAIVACESAQHFDTRAAFLAEALRVLRPGGRISLADMLFVDRAPVGEWMLPARNTVVTPEGYAALLTAAGFVDVEVRDVTAISWRPFCRRMAQALGSRAEEAEAMEASLGSYVLASASRPG